MWKNVSTDVTSYDDVTGFRGATTADNVTGFDDATSSGEDDVTSEGGIHTVIPIGVIVVLVLAAMCIILGSVYGYIYFTRISATSKQKPTRKPSKQDQTDEEKAANSFPSTHMLLFKMRHSHHNTSMRSKD